MQKEIELLKKEYLVNYIAFVFLSLIALVILLNVAFFSGYARGLERGKEEAVVIVQPVNPADYFREVRDISGGPMYTKPDIESRGRIGW